MKPKKNYSVKTDKPGPMDNCETPPYALEPLLPLLKGGSVIEVACGRKRMLERAMRVAGLDVIGRDIIYGDNFFECDIPKNRTIVTNPPYGIKSQWLRRCYELGNPFALLMPVETLGIESCASQFREHGIAVMFLTPRIDFYMPNEGWFSSAQFPVAWFYYQNIPLMQFAQVNKPKRTVSRQVMKKDRKTGEMKLVTETGYAEWIENPVGFDWKTNRFIYECDK